MKRLVLAFTLASLAALDAGVSAAPRPGECPAISVVSPDTVIVGSPVTFTVTVNGAPAGAKLTYNWVVSAGTITSSRDTTSITVDTTGVPYYWTVLTAAVDVRGLPESCAASASAAIAVYGIRDPRKIDEYGNLRWGDEKARLDNYIIELRNDPTMQACIICYGGRRGRAGEARRRCTRAADYVKRAGGIDAARVATIDGGYREEVTVELWPIPAGAASPQASPTVDPSEVVITRFKPRRARRKR